MATIKCENCALRAWRHEDKTAKVGPYCQGTGESAREGEDYQDCPRFVPTWEARQWKPRNP